MALTLDKPYLGLRIASSSNVPVFAPREGFCDDIVLDTPYVGLRASAVDGSPVFLISDQKLATGGTLTLNKPYIGLRASQVDGTLVFLVDGKVCDEGSIVLCDISLTSTGSIAVVKASGDTTGAPGVDPMFGTWSGLSREDGQTLLSDVSFDNYDFSATLISTTVGAPPFFTNGSSYQRPTSFGTCSTNITATAEAYGYQTPWTSFSGGEFKHVYLVSKVTVTVVSPALVTETCAYNFWTFQRDSEGAATKIWYFGYSTGTAQDNTWCGPTARLSEPTPLVNWHLGTSCTFGATGPSNGASVRKPYVGGVDVGPCMTWFAGP